MYVKGIITAFGEYRRQGCVRNFEFKISLLLFVLFPPLFRPARLPPTQVSDALVLKTTPWQTEEPIVFCLCVCVCVYHANISLINNSVAQ